MIFNGCYTPTTSIWLLLGFIMLFGVERNVLVLSTDRWKEVMDSNPYRFVIEDEPEEVRITEFEVPSQVQIHDDVTLSCKHNLQQGRLNSVTWRHNNTEFYRYATDEADPKVFFNDSGLLVDVSQSSETKLVLLNVSLTAAGVYQCEVMGEAPYFAVDKKKANMMVAVIPEESPLIEPPPDDGLRIGSNVEFNCTALPSNPSPTLDWEINGKKVPESHLRRYPLTKTKHGLYIQKLGLHFKVEKKHFVDSKLKLKCTARILSLYHKEEEHTHQGISNCTSDVGEPHAQPPIEGDIVEAGGSRVCLACGIFWWAAAVAVGLAL